VNHLGLEPRLVETNSRTKRHRKYKLDIAADRYTISEPESLYNLFTSFLQRVTPHKERRQKNERRWRESQRRRNAVFDEFFLVVGARRHGAVNHFFRAHRRRGHGVEEQAANGNRVSDLEGAEARDHVILLGLEPGVGKNIDLDGHNLRVLEERWEIAQSEGLGIAASVDGSDGARYGRRFELHLVDGNRHIRRHPAGKSGRMQADLLSSHEVSGAHETET